MRTAGGRRALRRTEGTALLFASDEFDIGEGRYASNRRGDRPGNTSDRMRNQTQSKSGSRRRTRQRRIVLPTIRTNLDDRIRRWLSSHVLDIKDDSVVQVHFVVLGGRYGDRDQRFIRQAQDHVR